MYSPDFDIPDGGEYLWNWFYSLSDSVTRVYDGICWAITPSEMAAWASLQCVTLHPVEFEILQAMDVAFCDEMNKELQAYFKRSQAKSVADAPAS